MQIAICDDSTNDCKNLEKMLKSFCFEADYQIEFFCYNSAEALLAEFKPQKFSMIFLDIFMGNITGIEAAKKIRLIDSDCVLVFTTTSTDYALEGFQVQALDYLVKPIQYQTLKNFLIRCEKLFRKSKLQIEISVNKLPVKIFICDIIYVEVYLNDSFIHTTKGTIKTRTVLTEIEQKLCGNSSFLRCHRSFLINMYFVKDINDDGFVMQDDVTAPIPRRERTLLKKAYNDFIVNQLKE